MMKNTLRQTSCRPVATLAFAPAAQRRAIQKSMVHLAYSTPSQFSSFHGVKMQLPECFVRRAKMAIVGMRKPAQMSFLGVGAPEAILVAIVALIVFGPKGLADAAKSVGQTLRTFQPTIKEVVSVSQDLKATLDKELGIDELRQAAQPIRPVSRTLDSLQPMTEDMAKDIDPDIEQKRAEASKMAWGGPVTENATGAGAASPSTPIVASTPVTSSSTEQPKDISNMSMADLEAEIARRKAASGGKA